MIRFKAILHILGLLMLLNGLFMALCLPISWNTGGTDFNALFYASVISVNLGTLIWYLTRKEKREFGKREGYMIVTFGWLILGITGSLPFIFSGLIPSIPSALFETISGFTTTGASILSDIESVPQGLLFWRSMTQWIGGMGIIVLTVAILPLFGVGGVELFMAESPGPSGGKLHPKITDTAKRLWVIYVIFTGIETVLLKLAGMSWFDAINHSFTTMSTGGFSTKNASIAAFNSPTIEYIITAFMFVGGINFGMLYFIAKFKIKRVFENEEFRVYVGLLLACSAIIGLLLYKYNGGAEESFRQGLFQVTTIITTTGFSTVNYSQWIPLAYMLIILLMFTGGSAGSTAGGVKIVRHLIVLKNGYLEFKRLLHPRGVIPVRVSKAMVKEKTVYNVLAFFLIYIMTFVVGTIVMTAFGHDVLTSAGASIACLGNIGPGFGEVHPGNNFSFFSHGAQLFLSFLMLLGRLELFTVLILLTPGYWKKI